MRSLATDIAIIVLLLFVAVGFRAPCMDHSLWLDELHTGWTISESLADVVPRAHMGNNLSPYFFLVRGVTSIIDHSEFALRLPSLFAGLAAIATGYVLVRRWTDSVAAATATAAIMMIDPHFLFYSVEARPYALIQWIGLFQVASFLAWLRVDVSSENERSSTTAACVWVATSTLLFHLHCTSILLPLAQLPLAMWFAQSQRWRYAVTWIAFLFLTLIAAPTLLEIYSRREAWNEFIAMPHIAGLLWLFPIAWPLAPAAAGWFTDRMIGGKIDVDTSKSDRRLAARAVQLRRLILIALMFAIPLLLAFFLTRTDIVRLFLRRYLIVVSGLPLLLAGLFIGHIRLRWLRYAVAVLALAAAIYSGPYRQLAKDGRVVRRSREDWRSTVKILNEQTQPGDVILIASDLIESDRLHNPDETANLEFMSYCALPLTGFYELRNDVNVIPIPMHEPSRHVTSLDNAKRINWIVSRRFDKERIESLVPPGATTIEHRERHPTIIEIQK